MNIVEGIERDVKRNGGEYKGAKPCAPTPDPTTAPCRSTACRALIPYFVMVTNGFLSLWQRICTTCRPV